MRAALLAIFSITVLAAQAPNAARSVHLRYQAPAATVFYNELTIEESVPGSYFMACGFRQGYFGIQQLSGNRPKVVLFSVWDPGAQNDPRSVPQDRQVEVLYHADDVTVRRFGGEGTGGQSFFNYDWKPGQTYRFMVQAIVEKEKTAFAAYFFLNETGAWKHLVTFRTATSGAALTGYYSFIEDFRRDGKSFHERRRARFGSGWVRTLDGNWQPLTTARFTGDATPVDNIDAGLAGTDFYLATGGDTQKHTELQAEITRPVSDHAPPAPINARYKLYACMAQAKNYVVGATLPPSGIFVKDGTGAWRHAGFNHPLINALDYDRTDPSTLYVAAGNGLLRATDNADHWKILTGSEVTELLDVAVDRNTPGAVYFSHPNGIRMSADRGATWRDAGAGPHRKYTAAIRVDSAHAGYLVIGNEEGIFRSVDAGMSWRLAGAASVQTRRIEQSPHDPCFWLAATEHAGLFASTDCGATFESAGNLGVGHNLYDIAFDPTAANRIAVAGWGIGVVVSEDRGKTWEPRNSGLPATSVWSVAFDPAHPRRLYAGVHEEALYVSNDSGRTWAKDGLEGSAVFRMLFVPEPAK